MTKAKWWQDAKFGMFIHWGLYSIPGRGEWLMWCENIPKEDYAKLAEEFTVEKCNPEEWVLLAKKTGMKYMVFTTRHHDGFCLYDSKVSQFTSVRTKCGRDIVREYVAACRKHGMPVGLYYSLLDWRYNAYFSGPEKDPAGWTSFIKYVHNQVKELMTGYGKIDILWYDGQWPYTAEQWQSLKLNEMVRKYQPDILINDRSNLPEDFDTISEQFIRPADRPWECVMPLNDFWWSYTPGERHLKTPYQIIRNLVACASHEGNYTLNIGPKPDGSVEENEKEILSEVGIWLKRNGESIYDTHRGISNEMPTPLLTTWGGITTKQGKTYLHILFWHREFTVPGIKSTVNEAYIFSNGQKVSFVQSGDRVHIRNLPDKPLNPYNTVIVLEHS